MTQLPLMIALAGAVSLVLSAAPARHAGTPATAPSKHLTVACATDPFCTNDDGVHRGVAAPAVHRGIALSGITRGVSLAVACDAATDPFCDDGVHRGVAAPAVHRGIALSGMNNAISVAMACPADLPVCTGDDGVHRG